jgi:hypothetical protein
MIQALLVPEAMPKKAAKKISPVAADSKPFAIRRTLRHRHFGFRSPHGERHLAQVSRDGHLPMTRGDRVERAFPLVMTTPDPLDKRRVGRSVFEEEKQGTAYLSIYLPGQRQPSPKAQWAQKDTLMSRKCPGLDAK